MWPHVAADEHSLRSELRGELDALVPLGRQRLELAGDGGASTCAEVARLRRVGLLHLLQQQLPRLVVRFQLALVTDGLARRPRLRPGGARARRRHRPVPGDPVYAGSRDRVSSSVALRACSLTSRGLQLAGASEPGRHRERGQGVLCRGKLLRQRRGPPMRVVSQLLQPALPGGVIGQGLRVVGRRRRRQLAPCRRGVAGASDRLIQPRARASRSPCGGS